MESLKKLAKDKVVESRSKGEEFDWVEYKDNLTNLNEEIQEQRLIIMELEEMNGAITQENGWLMDEVEKLKVQVHELEDMIFGERDRLASLSISKL